RDEDVLQRRAASVVRVDVAGGDRANAECLGEIAKRRVPACVTAFERTLQLDEEAIAPERGGETGGSIGMVHAEAVAGTAGEADEPVVQLLHQSLVERRRQRLAILPRTGTGMRRGEQSAQVRVTGRALDEQRHVRSAVECDLRAGDRADAEVLR